MYTLMTDVVQDIVAEKNITLNQIHAYLHLHAGTTDEEFQRIMGGGGFVCETILRLFAAILEKPMGHFIRFEPVES